MKRTINFALVASIALGMAAYFARRTPACSPGAFWPEPIFINALHPDLPIMGYDRGNLGVIEPTYATIYLAVAYRELNGHPLSTNEEQAIWTGDDLSFAGSSARPVPPPAAAQQQDWEVQWGEASGTMANFGTPPSPYAPQLPPTPGIYREITLHANGTVLYSNILNCPEEAFHAALTTLNARNAQSGASSPIVKNWLQAQAMVFDNCGGPGEIPAPLRASAPASARADRAYQIAAAHFYAGDYDEAASEFRAIGEDESSPWSTVAPYLVARALVRKAVVGHLNPDLSALAQGETQLKSVLADPRQSKYHHAAEELRGFVEFRLHPAARLAELANLLTAARSDPDLAQNAIDFELLSPIVTENYSWQTPPPLQPKLYATLGDARAASDALDWILTLRLNMPEAYDHALDRWERTRSLDWLIAALTKASPDSPHLRELMTASRAVPPASPAYLSVTFQTLRLMVLAGQQARARARLAALQIQRLETNSRIRPTPPSALNLFLALRFELARTREELFENAPRVAATVTSANSNRQMPQPIWVPNGNFDPNAPMLDGDALTVFNRFLPVSVLAQAASDRAVPDNLREEIGVAAWTRAALLGDDAIAKSLTRVVIDFHPELKATLSEYNAARSADERRFIGALAALRFPGLRPFITTPERWTPVDQIDDFRDNWWGTLGPVCAPPSRYSGPGYPRAPQWPELGAPLQAIYPGRQVNPPAFLSANERRQAASEWRELTADSPAPDYLTRQAISWANEHPSDARAPEALALAVKATRVGCDDEQTGALSKAAFDLLHRSYPRSRWALQTKYWFKM
ncbi:MAG: hypothetical protein ACRD3D_10815 [Terriglobia bacterium]